MPETLLPIVFTASSSSFWRRPVMKTYAPSLTKSFAVANPIPSVPPVMTAILPSSFLAIVVSPYRLQEEHRDFTACAGSVGGEIRPGGVCALPPFVLFLAEDFARPHLLLDRAILQFD